MLNIFRHQSWFEYIFGLSMLTYGAGIHYKRWSYNSGHGLYYLTSIIEYVINPALSQRSFLCGCIIFNGGVREYQRNVYRGYLRHCWTSPGERVLYNILTYIADGFTAKENHYQHSTCHEISWYIFSHFDWRHPIHFGVRETSKGRGTMTKCFKLFSHNWSLLET